MEVVSLLVFLWCKVVFVDLFYIDGVLWKIDMILCFILLSKGNGKEVVFFS